MNDPTSLIEKLEQLVFLARDADNDYEKAAVYAAATSIAQEFMQNEDDFDPYTLEKIESARWSLCAAVGYDITNGHNRDQHVVWALGAISTLKSIFENKNT